MSKNHDLSIEDAILALSYYEVELDDIAAICGLSQWQHAWQVKHAVRELSAERMTWIYDRKPDDRTDVLITARTNSGALVRSVGQYIAGSWLIDRFAGFVDDDRIIAWAELPPAAQPEGT